MVGIRSGAAAERAYGAAAPSPVATQATLDRLRHQLSDCVNCASARTREGQANIASIEERIARLAARSLQPGDAVPTMPVGPATAAGAASGSLIDVFA